MNGTTKDFQITDHLGNVLWDYINITKTFAHEYGHNNDRFNQYETYKDAFYGQRENSAIRRVNPLRDFYGKPERYEKNYSWPFSKYGGLKP